MAIELVPLCTATLTLAEPFVIPDSPVGTRVIIEVEDFVVEGDRLNARQKGKAGADWLTINAALLGTIDVRALLETDDGALIYTCTPAASTSPRARAPPRYSAPLYETGDERYAWLNKIQAVAKGIVSNDGQHPHLRDRRGAVARRSVVDRLRRTGDRPAATSRTSVDGGGAALDADQAGHLADHDLPVHAAGAGSRSHQRTSWAHGPAHARDRTALVRERAHRSTAGEPRRLAPARDRDRPAVLVEQLGRRRRVEHPRRCGRGPGHARPGQAGRRAIGSAPVRGARPRAPSAPARPACARPGAPGSPRLGAEQPLHPGEHARRRGRPRPRRRPRSRADGRSPGSPGRGRAAAG